jgi:DNA adenine methylase
MEIGMRYPGSKAKLVDQILARLPDNLLHPLWTAGSGVEYCEPFFGAGAVGIEILRRLAGYGKPIEVVLGDLDYGVVCYWNAIKSDPHQLAELVLSFEPAADRYYEFKEKDGQEDADPVLVGFRKLALHQMSFSGLGFKSGGPLGGRKAAPDAPYNPACRWNPELLVAKILRINRLFARFPRLRVVKRDFVWHFNRCTPRTFFYLDPPYYEKGPALYKHAFDDADHVRLRGCLSRTQAAWVLSYDDHPRIRELFAGYQFEPVQVVYTTATARTPRRPKNAEVLIYP